MVHKTSIENFTLGPTCWKSHAWVQETLLDLKKLVSHSRSTKYLRSIAFTYEPPSTWTPSSLPSRTAPCELKYLNVMFPNATSSIHAVATLHIVRWNILRRTAASVDSSAHTFHKPILAPLPGSDYDSPPTPSAISVPVGVYNLGRLCIQWCQNRDGTAAVGLCTCTARHSSQHNKTALNTVTLSDWRQYVCYSFNECYRPNSTDNLCGITDRHFVTLTLWLNTDVCSAILKAVSSDLLFFITLYDLL